jgi:hypothetical protein
MRGYAQAPSGFAGERRRSGESDDRRSLERDINQ